MRRRAFLSTLPAMAATGALLKPARSSAATDTWKDQFAAALAEDPALLAFSSVSAPAFDAQASVAGEIPAELRGSLFRNGPARHEIGEFRYHHWFDGDGMVQAFRINADGITHRARMVATRKYLAELDAGRALYPGFATLPPSPAPVTSPDLANVANISVLPHHGKLYALWEAGSPWEIDPETLETRGLHKFADASGNTGLTAGLPFSAHPRVATDGTLWNFGYLSTAGKLVFWHINRDGTLNKVGAIDCKPMTMPHDFVVTSRHLVMLLPPFNFDARSAMTTFLDAHQWQPDQATRVLIVDKNDFSQHRFLELPAQWVFHFGNAWEDEAGVIRFDAARAATPVPFMDSMKALMRGERRQDDPTNHYQYQIDTRRWTVTEQPLLSGISSEFPAIDPRVSCERYSQVVMLSSQQNNPAAHGMLNCVSRFNLERGDMDTFRYPDTIIPEEHLFVPKPGSAPESAGWVLGTALNYASANTELRIFDAQHLGDGPLATATLPYALPLGLHGKFA